MRKSPIINRFAIISESTAFWENCLYLFKKDQAERDWILAFELNKGNERQEWEMGIFLWQKQSSSDVVTSTIFYLSFIGIRPDTDQFQEESSLGEVGSTINQILEVKEHHYYVSGEGKYRRCREWLLC